ncbi:MAG: methyltransferase [Magnetovibrio sp.]|nr:methyltransferase [Magnetovibrio sp.]
MNAHKDRIVQAFSKSAQTYDLAAQVQADVASEVAANALRCALPVNPDVLEIGCGTGGLTRRILDGISGGRFLISDISAQMLACCQGNTSDSRASFVRMDGEHPDLGTQSFDLIVSSLAIQWFSDLNAGLERLSQHLKPGGHIVFSTLGEHTFKEWRAAHADLELLDGMPAFLSSAAITLAWPKSGRGEVREKRIQRGYADARTFARTLKTIGANTPAMGHRPLSPKNFRRVSDQLGQNFTNTYHVVFGQFTKV